MATPFDFEITATDKTAAGVKSAEKRLGTLGKTLSKSGESGGGKGGGLDGRTAGIGRYTSAAKKADVETNKLSNTLGKIDHGISSTLGGGNLSAAASGVLKIGQAGAEAAESLGAMGLAGAGLAGLAVAAAAAAAATAKVAEGWDNANTSLGRMSKGIGVGIRDLQKFEGAFERYGVSKEGTDQALGGIGSAVHGAIYGRNPEAAAALAKLAIPVTRKTDGSVDTAAMTLALADATKAQKSPQSQAHLAQIFGFGSALPAMREGSAALRPQLSDVEKHGRMVSEADVSASTQEAFNRVARRQEVSRGLSGAGRLAHAVVSPIADAIGQGMRASDDSPPSLGRAESPGRLGELNARPTPQQIITRFQERGLSRTAAVGMAAQVLGENSRLDPHQHQSPHGPGYGLFQDEDPRQREFAKWSGHKMQKSNWQEQVDFAAYELHHKESPTLGKLEAAKTYAEAGRVGVGFERPFDSKGAEATRSRIAERIGQAPDAPSQQRVHVTVEVLDKRVTAKVKAENGGVAIGHAMRDASM